MSTGSETQPDGTIFSLFLPFKRLSLSLSYFMPGEPRRSIFSRKKVQTERNEKPVLKVSPFLSRSHVSRSPRTEKFRSKTMNVNISRDMFFSLVYDLCALQRPTAGGRKKITPELDYIRSRSIQHDVTATVDSLANNLQKQDCAELVHLSSSHSFLSLPFSTVAIDQTRDNSPLAKENHR